MTRDKVNKKLMQKMRNKHIAGFRINDFAFYKSSCMKITYGILDSILIEDRQGFIICRIQYEDIRSIE